MIANLSNDRGDGRHAERDAAQQLHGQRLLWRLPRAAYNRTTNDAKITYIPNDNTQIFGKYSIEPFQVNDPQQLGPAGGGTFDGGQPGAGHGKIQNVGMGVSHVINSDIGDRRRFRLHPPVVGSAVDARSVTGRLRIERTADSGNQHQLRTIRIISVSRCSALTAPSARSATPTPPIRSSFRDNQFTGDVNLSWVKGKHSVQVPGSPTTTST